MPRRFEDLPLPPQHSSFTSLTAQWGDGSEEAAFPYGVHSACQFTNSVVKAARVKRSCQTLVTEFQHHQHKRPHAYLLDERSHNNACSQKYNLALKVTYLRASCPKTASPSYSLASHLNHHQSLVLICFLATTSVHISTMSPYKQGMFI